MTQNELNTFKTFVNSNKYFSNALNNGTIYIDSNIKIELIIYYLTINEKYITESLTPYNKLLHNLITLQNYTINGENIIIEDTIISIPELIILINKIEQTKIKDSSKKIIYLTTPTLPKEPKINKSYKSGQILHFSEAARQNYYTNVERGIIFERTTKINDQTLPYISTTQSEFIALVNDIVLKVLNGRIEEYNPKYLKVIAAYLTLYPFITYLRNKQEIPFEELNINQHLIGTRKMQIKNKHLSDIEKRIILLNKRENSLLNERDLLEKSPSLNPIILTRIEQERLDIEKERTGLMFTMYVLKTSPELYNSNLLNYIVKSFEKGYIEINRFFSNPIIKLFYIEDNETKFHSSMRLDTLSNIIDFESILSRVEGKRLKKEV